MSIKKCALLIFAVCLYCNMIYAQTTPPPSGPSTDTKPDDVYAEQKQISSDIAAKSNLIPVALPEPKSLISINESGDGLISLPFVVAKGRKLSLPISLTYRTDGIKVDQNSSDVGLGWNINIGSITRDYGAFEPDYTYTGSEFAMPDVTGYSFGNKKLRSINFSTDASYMAPINQNKVLDYNNTSGTAPDDYIVNVPGIGSNDFWNSNAASDATTPTPNFTFSEKNSWQISYQKKTFILPQEISRINEYTFHLYGTNDVPPTTTSTLDDNYNKASAIGFFPYVINCQTSKCVANTGLSGSQIVLDANSFVADASYSSSGQEVLTGAATIQYEDYSQFTITTDNGTQYVFGRPLRGQKYLFNEEPFWSTSVSAPWSGGAMMGPDKMWSYGEFWKTDFISEWLLTEIHSSDYVDANGDGIANDGDYGDWIRIDYGVSTQCENGTLPYAYLVPAHREFENFVETDRPSAIWKEKAYVSTITTPVEVIDFTTERRFDVNHDYFQKPFNRYNNNYCYEGVPVSNAMGVTCGDYTWASVSTNPAGIPTVNYISPTISDCNTYVNYPAELMRYDGATVYDNISSGLPQIQGVQLNYATQGSAQQLAVSHHLIIDNEGNFKDYDPATCGDHPSVTGRIGVDPSYLVPSVGRGKTTLLGIDYLGSSSTSTNKISYSFAYGNNPSYDNIHMQQIWSLASGSVRETRASTFKRWTGPRTIFNPSGSGASSFYNMPNSILPWKSLTIDRNATNETSSGANGIRFTSTVNWGNPVYEDELGYYYDGSSPNQGRDAWTLSQITLPYGGNVSIKYSLDQSDLSTDRSNWKIPDYCLPEIGYFNNIAVNRSILQQIDNEWEGTYPSFYSSGYGKNYARLTGEYYYNMNNSTGGLRINEIDYNDTYGAPAVTKTYNYGTGHNTAPPAEYWQNYMSGFEAFMYNEYIRRGNYDADGVFEKYDDYFNVPDYSEYLTHMMRLNLSLRIDASYRKSAKHYYEYIEEVNADGGKTRWYYGALMPNSSLSNPRVVYAPMKYGLIKYGNSDRQNNIDLMSSDLTQYTDIGNYKTEYYNNSGQIVQTESSDYTYSASSSNTISFASVSLINGDYFPYVPAWLHINTGGTDPYPTQSVWSSSSTSPSCNAGEGLQPVSATASWITPGGYHENQIYNNMPSWLQTLSQYRTSSSDPNVQAIAQAKNTFTQMATQCGLFTSMPAWFSNITATPKLWAGTYSDATVSSNFATAINSNTINPNIVGPVSFFIDLSLTLPATSTINQLSKSLLPTHKQTIKKFY